MTGPQSPSPLSVETCAACQAAIAAADDTAGHADRTEFICSHSLSSTKMVVKRAALYRPSTEKGKRGLRCKTGCCMISPVIE